MANVYIPGQHEDNYGQLPYRLAQQAEPLARAESRTVSELLREAFRTYRASAVRRRLVEGNEYARGRSSGPYTANDVEDLVSEARRELAGESRRSE